MRARDKSWWGLRLGYGVLQSPEFLQFFVRFAGLSLLAIKTCQAEMCPGPSVHCRSRFPAASSLPHCSMRDESANRRLKMAVRGGVAEEHLVRRLKSIPGVTDCRRLDDEGRPVPRPAAGVSHVT